MQHTRASVGSFPEEGSPLLIATQEEVVERYSHGGHPRAGDILHNTAEISEQVTKIRYMTVACCTWCDVTSNWALWNSIQ